MALKKRIDSLFGWINSPDEREDFKPAYPLTEEDFQVVDDVQDHISTFRVELAMREYLLDSQPDAMFEVRPALKEMPEKPLLGRKPSELEAS